MKPILLAMCNPRSSDPDNALWPDPPGCSGWRLWKLLSSRTGATQKDYLEAFDRRNLVETQYWDVKVARIRAGSLVGRLAGREVVILGSDVRNALQVPPLLVHPQEIAGVVYRQLPHPSGRCLWYNSEDNRLLAALLLESLYEGSR